MDASETRHGYLHIETNTRSFFAGQPLEGLIHLSLTRPVSMCTVFLKLKGVEMSVVYPLYMSSFGDQDLEHDVPANCVGKGVIVRQKFPIFRFTIDPVYPGGYIFPFKITLPADIPGSFRVAKAITTGKIVYRLIALLEGCGRVVTQHKVPIWITQINIDPVYSVSENAVVRVSRGCCLNDGVVGMKVGLLKNSYVPGETVAGVVEVDNSNCRVAIRELQVAFLRKMVVTNNDGVRTSQSEPVRLLSLQVHIPPAGSLLGESSVRFEIVFNDSDPAIREAVTVHSRYVQCSFAVTVKAIMDAGWFFDARSPEVEQPVLIYPKQMPAMAPSGEQQAWDPEVLPVVQFNISEEYEDSLNS